MKTSIRIAAVASISSLVFLAAGNVTALAAADPDNHGHHYGQLKHPKVSTPPPPVPVPTPHPIVQPTPSVVPVVHSPSAAPAVHTPSAGNVTAVPVQPSSPIATPPQEIVSPVAPAIQLTEAESGLGQYDWLILLILPTLLAIWLIACVGLARRLSGVRSKAMQVQAAPA